MTVLFQVVVIVMLAPLLHGSMKSLRARLQGRPGPPVIQPYRDIVKFWRKEALLPDDVSPIAVAAPGIVLGVSLTFAAVLPMAMPPMPFADVIGLALLLALSRFASTLAALDVRSAFTAMAASRDLTFASLAEPALLIALLGGAVIGHGTSLTSIAVPFVPGRLCAGAAFFLIMLLETARVPIDNQETHYELTMIHEGLTLEYSGWQLAFVQIAAHVRQLCFFVLAVLLLLPGSPLWIDVVGIVTLGLAVTLVETAFAKVRLFEVPQILTSAFILAATSVGLDLFGGAS